MRKGITERTSVRSWRTVQERTMRMREQWVRDNDLPLTRYGKYIIRATYLFPYPWPFQVLTVLADEESGVKQGSICEWRGRRSLSMGKTCLKCAVRYKHDLLRVTCWEWDCYEVRMALLKWRDWCPRSWIGGVWTSYCPCDINFNIECGSGSERLYRGGFGGEGELTGEGPCLAPLPL